MNEKGQALEHVITQDGSRSSELSSFPIPRGWWPTLKDAAINILMIRETLSSLRSENVTLRDQLDELVKIVHRQTGQIEQMDKRIEVQVELQVLKRMNTRARLGTDAKKGDRTRRY